METTKRTFQVLVQCVVYSPSLLSLTNTSRRSDPASLHHPSIYSFVHLSVATPSLKIHSTMPRRPPPTALRLATGPTPPRSRPKHVLPSVPLPTFHPLPISESHSSHAPAPRQTAQKMSRTELPPLDIPFLAGGNGNNASPISADSMRAGKPKIIKGPWDHSGCISLEFDVESMLAPLKPAIVSPRTGAGGNY